MALSLLRLLQEQTYKALGLETDKMRTTIKTEKWIPPSPPPKKRDGNHASVKWTIFNLYWEIMYALASFFGPRKIKEWERKKKNRGGGVYSMLFVCVKNMPASHTHTHMICMRAHTHTPHTDFSQYFIISHPFKPNLILKFMTHSHHRFIGKIYFLHSSSSHQVGNQNLKFLLFFPFKWNEADGIFLEWHISMSMTDIDKIQQYTYYT